MHSPRTEPRPDDAPPRRAATGPARRAPFTGALPHMVVTGVCAAYAAGAALGWGTPRLALIMGDFGLCLAAAAAGLSCLYYARRGAGEFRPAWLLFGVSSLTAAVGNGVWGWYEVVLGEPVPRFSAADLCFLLFAPLAIVGLLLLAERPATRAGRVRLALDATLIGGSLLTLSWSVALNHTAQWQGAGVPRSALALAYPLLDIALVSCVLVLRFRRSAAHRTAINTTIGALCLTVLCDALFTSPLLREQYTSGQLLDAGWFAGSVLLGCAPWLPARQRSRPARSSAWPLVGSLAALMPYLAAAVCTLSILITVTLAQEVDRVVVFTASAVVLALVVRQAIMLLDNIALTRELSEQESHFRSLVQGSSDVIMIAAPDGILRYVSPAAAGVYGLDADGLIGRQLAELLHPDDLDRVHFELRRFLAATAGPPEVTEPTVRIECRVRHGAGHWLNVESTVNRHHSGLIFNSRDVTERVRLQAQLQHSASHDPLTDLPNRALFTERVRAAVHGRRGADTDAAVFYIDLDGFKAVNDSAGHQTGDELLVQAARRLRQAVRAQDTTARLGGDEFAALVAGVPGNGDERPRESRVLEIAERVRAALSAPYEIAGRTIEVAASIGIAFAGSGATPAELLRNADLAMYRAKQAGKGRVELYRPGPQPLPSAAPPGALPPGTPAGAAAGPPGTPSSAPPPSAAVPPLPAAPRPAALIPAPANGRNGRARHSPASAAGEGVLLHQPVVQLADGTVTALCAQGRRHAALPGVRLLEETVAQAARRRQHGCTLPVSVRLSHGPDASAGHLAQGAAAVAELLARHALPPQALTVELTATEAGTAVEAAEPARQLARLRSLGVGLALDGLGGDRLPVTALHRLPVTEVRLARELVDGLLDAPELCTIAAGLLRLAAELGIGTVAGGVDRPEQAAALRALGCARGRGAALSEPLDDGRLEAVLRRGRVPLPPAGCPAADGPRPAISAPRRAVKP